MNRYQCIDFLVKECKKRNISVTSLVLGAGLSCSYTNKMNNMCFITNKLLIRMFNQLGINPKDFVEPDFCEVCGKEFEKTSEKTVCCSRECSDIRSRKKQKMEHDKRKCKLIVHNGISEVQAKAQNLGMTYGQYVALYEYRG